LVAFCEAHDVQAWTEHFFMDRGKPELAMVLQYEERAERRRGGRAPKQDREQRRELPATLRPAYDRLRQWRSLRSRRDGVPVYVVFSNREVGVHGRRPGAQGHDQAVCPVPARAGRRGGGRGGW
jgi:hypothetical protein